MEGLIYLGALEISRYVTALQIGGNGMEVTMELANPPESLRLLVIGYTISDKLIPLFVSFPTFCGSIWIYSYRVPSHDDVRFRRLAPKTTNIVFGGNYGIPF